MEPAQDLVLTVASRRWDGLKGARRRTRTTVLPRDIAYSTGS